MFVPATKGSQLRKALQVVDGKFAALHKEPPVRMVEQGGTKLSSIICKADPWAGATCGRALCVPCDTSAEGKGGGCFKENVLYRITCATCQGENICSQYTGESSRSLFQRMAEHLRGARKEDPRNPLHTHTSRLTTPACRVSCQ